MGEELRYTPAIATTEQREAARASDLYRHGDMQLVWINEGDLVEAELGARSRTITKEQVEACTSALLAAADYPIEADVLALAAAKAFGLVVEE